MKKCEHCGESILEGHVVMARIDGKEKFFHVGNQNPTDCFTNYILSRGSVIILEREALVISHSMNINDLKDLND